LKRAVVSSASEAAEVCISLFFILDVQFGNIR
jgi:hypothetical protein